MPDSDAVTFSCVSDFIHAIAIPERAQVLFEAGAFVVDGNRYQVTYVESGPQVTRLGDVSPIVDLFRHRVAEGSAASYAARMAKAIAGNPSAARLCLWGALEAWRADRPEQGRAVAVDRLMACHDRQLPELDLRDLGLTELPHALGSFRQLEALRLGGNALTALPDTIARLTSLHVLEVDGNRLASLPNWLGKLENLRVLSLANNRLTQFPERLLKLPYLAHVWVGGNPIEELWEWALFYPPGFEMVACGAPLKAWVLGDVADIVRRQPCVPIHHEKNPPLREETDRLWAPSMASSRFGRLAFLIHETAAGTPAIPAMPQSVLCDADAWDAARLIREVEETLRADDAVWGSERILSYRVGLVLRWMATDVALFRSCVAALQPSAAELGSIWERRPELVRARFDDVELKIIDHILARQACDLERLVSFGRGLFRLSLLRDVLAVRYPNDPRKLEREAYYRILLAEELGLPGTTWPVTSLRDAFGFFEARLPVVANEVLKKESEHDFARLDDFMGAWKPWQAYIARDRPTLIAGLKQDRQRLLDEAERLQANGAIAAAGLKAVREKLAQQQEVAVRELYRAQFRELRRSGKAGVSATGNRPEARHVEANRNGVADAQSVPASDRHAIPASAPH